MAAEPFNTTEKPSFSLTAAFYGEKPLYYIEFDPKTEQLKMEVVTTEFKANNAVTKNADSSIIYVGDGIGK